jgi:hypothetical protein
MMLQHLLTSCRTAIGIFLLYHEHVSSIVPDQVIQSRRRGRGLPADDFKLPQDVIVNQERSPNCSFHLIFFGR